MRLLSAAVARFIQAEDGPTAVEYAVMLALIIVVCIAAITTLGNNAKTTFTSVGTTIAPYVPPKTAYSHPPRHLAAAKPAPSPVGPRRARAMASSRAAEPRC